MGTKAGTPKDKGPGDQKLSPGRDDEPTYFGTLLRPPKSLLQLLENIHNALTSPELRTQQATILKRLDELEQKLDRIKADTVILIGARKVDANVSDATTGGEQPVPTFPIK